MDFLPPELDKYVVEHSQEEPPLLKELSRETWMKVLNPRMLAGHLQGRTLSMLCHMIQPKTILEIGTFTGYSAICMAEGLQEKGTIHTIDINEELETMATKYFEKAGIKENIKQYVGHALDIIPTIDTTYDIVFIDADKSNYINYYNEVFDRVRTGGYIIADNVLWSGKVLDPKNNNDPDTHAIIEYSKMVQADDRVQNVLFPIRDGLQVARKLV